MHIEIRSGPLNPWKTLVDYQQGLEGFGATSVFVGTMRDFNASEQVSQMYLEHYPEMTEKHLREICEHAENRWQLLDVLVIHRVGKLFPSDPIVLVAAWAAHRKAAFEATRFIMEDLKAKAPFWKKETLEVGDRWVRENTPGY